MVGINGIKANAYKSRKPNKLLSVSFLKHLRLTNNHIIKKRPDSLNWIEHATITALRNNRSTHSSIVQINLTKKADIEALPDPRTKTIEDLCKGAKGRYISMAKL